MEHISQDAKDWCLGKIAGCNDVLRQGQFESSAYELVRDTLVDLLTRFGGENQSALERLTCLGGLVQDVSKLKLKFAWSGWTAHEGGFLPTLEDEDRRVVWEGGYYSDLDKPGNVVFARAQLQGVVEKFGITGYDFSSDNVMDWGFEDKRKS